MKEWYQTIEKRGANGQKTISNSHPYRSWNWKASGLLEGGESDEGEESLHLGLLELIGSNEMLYENKKGAF